MITFRSFIQRKSRPVVAALGSMLTFRNVVLPLLFGAILVCTHAQQVHAGPKDGNVVAGDANIVQLNPKLLEIIQGSDKVIIDWRSFSIDWDELVRFLQPDSDSIALNRVNGDTPSYILGQLTADGRVMLINPNGVLFGDSAVVDIGSLVATTIDIRNEDFMAGDYNFDVDRASGGTVVNRGRITAAEGGIVALVAPGVENSGVIVARLGRVALASGNSFALDFYGDRLIQIGVDDSVAERLLAPDGTELKALVDNSGEIYADGGTVMLMAASVAKDVVDYAINMEGIIEARTATERNGQIVLEGAGEGIVRVTGTLDASGRESGDAGGNVKILGSKVGIVGQAEVDVSGDAGGGEVLIGGNFQGRGPERNAEFTTIGREVAIQADALTTGDGGRVIVWSDRVTRFYGNISARGGSVSGDGGFAEISGKQHLQFAPNSIDLSAPKGLIGELLLDPLDIVISDGDGSDDSAVSMDNVIYFNDDSTATYNITPAAFEAIDADITLQALQDITVSSPIDRTGSGDSTLTLQAGRNLTIDANITGSNGAHSFIFEADSPRSSNNDGVGTLTIASGVTITSSNRTSNTGDITFGHITLIGAEFDINATSSINAGGDIYVAPSRAVAMMISTAASDLSNTNLSNAEIGTFTTSGTIYIGTATTGPDGSGGAGSSISASGITVSEDLTISGSADSTLALQAGGHLTINADITGTNGAHSIILEADSPGSSNNNGVGTLTIASGVIITSNNGDITLIGAEFDINATSMTSIDAGTGDIYVAPSQAVAMTISTTADLSLAEIGRFTTSGTIHIGTATSGSGGAGSTISASSITVSEDLTISGSASLVLDSGGMTTLSADVSTYDGDITFADAVILGADVTVNSDADDDGTDGDITFTSTVDGGHALTLDADMGTSGLNPVGGRVILQGAAGGTTKLASLEVDGGRVSLKSVSTTGKIEVTASALVPLISLIGDYLSDNGDIKFTGRVLLFGTVRVDSNADDDATAGMIEITSTVDGGYALTVDAGGGLVKLVTEVGGGTKLASLTVVGGQIEIGNVRTINNIDITGTKIDLNQSSYFKSDDGNITFNGPVDLHADVTVISDEDDDGTAGNITFTSTVDGAQALTVNAGGGTVELQGAVGGTTKLASLKVTGGTITLSADVLTDNGAITFTGAVDLAGDVTVSSGATGGAITFTSTVDGGHALTVSAGSGTVDFQGAVGGTTKLASLTVTGGQIDLYTVATTGNIDIEGSTGIALNGATYASDDGDITFGGAGGVTISGSLDSTVSLQAGGDLTINTNITGRNGAHSLIFEADSPGLSSNDGNGTLKIASGVTITSNNGDITLIGAGFDIDTSSSINAGTGDIHVAPSQATAAMIISNAATGNLSDAEIGTFTTSGTIYIGTATTGPSGSGVAGSSISASGITVSQDLTISGSASLVLDSSGVTTLSADVSTYDGDITFKDAVTLGANVTVDSDADGDGTGGTITFTSTVDGGQVLTVDAGGGAVALQGAVGGTTRLSDLAVTGGTITLSADVSTDNGAITFTGAVALAGDVTLNSGATGGAITFTSTVVSAAGGNRTLTVNAGSGAVEFRGAVGGTTALSGLAVIGGMITLSADVSTDNGAITFTGAVTLAGDVTVNSGATGGAITFTSTVDGGYALTLNAGSATVDLQGAVGGTTKLASLTVDGGQIDIGNVVTINNIDISGTNINLYGSIYGSNDGNITFNGPVDLHIDVTVNSDADDDPANGDITFISTVDGSQTLTLNAGTGNIYFGGDVGSSDKLSAITVNNAHDVTVATTMWVGSFTQSAGTGTTDFGSDTIYADTSVDVTTVNIRGKIVTQDAAILKAQEDIRATVEVDSLTIEASNAYLVGTVGGVRGRAFDNLIEIINKGSGTYRINEPTDIAAGIKSRTYLELSSLPPPTVTHAAGVFASFIPILRASVSDSIYGPYIVTDFEKPFPLLTPEHGAEDYYEDIPLLLKTHDDEMVEME